MSKFKVGDRVRILNVESSGLPKRFLNCTVKITSFKNCGYRVRFCKGGIPNWTIKTDDIELVTRMNRNNANFDIRSKIGNFFFGANK